MGNNLAAIVPSSILPVGSYLGEVSDIQNYQSLGNTRFMKVLRCNRINEGEIVIKVFVIPSSQISLQQKQEEIQKIERNLRYCPNCLPFQQSQITDKAGFLFRQFVHHNLYDRLSIRPFLTDIEKRWIAYQLLLALAQCFKSHTSHGDIKTENVMITSWGWLLLTDFASFKPTYLPSDNPSDFNYYFDTSRRRTCYIAVERFEVKEFNTTPLYELTPSMDIYSAGCVIAELFLDEPLFDLFKLMEYRNRKYDPRTHLAKIKNPEIAAMIASMIELDPGSRAIASEYLSKYTPSIFPLFFKTFLYEYMKQYAMQPKMLPDEVIDRLAIDFPQFENILSDRGAYCSAILIIQSLVAANIRSLRYCESKLCAIKLIGLMSEAMESEAILERNIPLCIWMFKDLNARVRCEAIRVLTSSLMHVTVVPRSEANIFPEYIFPELRRLERDPVLSVRAQFAACVAPLAKCALRFLDLSQEYSRGSEAIPSDSPLMNYDSELAELQTNIQGIMKNLIQLSEPLIVRTILHGDRLNALCVFFGRKGIGQFMLDHLCTLLNFKEDWQLRAQFFESIVSLAAYQGWQSTTFLKAFLLQGLLDPEEFVVVSCVNATGALCDLNLLKRADIFEIADHIAPLCFHPNLWIRHSAVGFIASCASALSLADRYGRLRPLISNYLTRDVVQLQSSYAILCHMRPALSRKIFDQFLRLSSVQLEGALNFAEQTVLKNHLVNTNPAHCRSKSSTVSSLEFDKEDEQLQAILTRLFANGMRTEDLEKVLQLRFLLEQGNQERSLNNPGNSYLGKIIVSTIKPKCYEYSGDDKPVPRLAELGSRRKPRAPPASLQCRVLDFANAGIVAEKLPISEYRSRQTSSCARTLDAFLKHADSLYSTRVAANNYFSTFQNEFKVIDSKWCLSHHLVAHLQEHSSIINRMSLSRDHAFFASVSEDGTCCIWDTERFESGKPTNKSSLVIESRNQSPYRSVAFCGSRQKIALATAAGDIALHHLSIESENRRISQKQESMRHIDCEDDGPIVDMGFLSPGSEDILVYATMNGSISGWDLRIPNIKSAFELQSDLRYGLITSLLVHPNQMCLVSGTSSGAHMIWDLRFQLPVKTLNHPTGRRVRRLLAHPSDPSLFISSVQDNNEVSIWEIESGARTTVLLANAPPPYNSNNSGTDAVHAMFGWISTDHQLRILTGGSDQRIRLWDTMYPAESYIFSPAALDGRSHTISTSYSMSLVEGTQIIEENFQRKPKGQSTKPPRGPELPDPGHRDIISDLLVYQTQFQTFLVSADFSGVIKLWK